MAELLVSSGGLEQASEDHWSHRTLDPWTPDEEEDGRVVVVKEKEYHKQRMGSPLRLDLSPFNENTGLEEEEEGEEEEEVILGRRHSDLFPPSPPPLSNSITYPPPLAGSEADPELIFTSVPDPIRLRGVGGTTMFGLNNRFENDFPSYLVGKVSEIYLKLIWVKI